MLTSTPAGVTDYIDGDLREPDTILDSAAGTLDFDEPVGVMLLGILEFLPDHEQAYGIVSRLMDAVPSGSFLVIAHSTNEIETEAMNEAARRWNEGGSTSLTLRDRAELSRFFDGLEVLEPGIGSCSQWRPDKETSFADREVPQFCGVGRKP